MLELTKAEAKKIASDNGYYDWRLDTPVTESAYQELFDAFRLAVIDKIDRAIYLGCLYDFFQIIYDQTLLAWQANRIQCRQQYELEHPTHTHLPVDCIKLSARELEFINERWRCWVARDGEIQVPDAFDNNIGEIDYSYIEKPDSLVRSEKFVMNFGKYHIDKFKRYVTIEELWHTNPQYLLWAHKNVDRFKMSEEMVMQTEEWVEYAERERR